MNKRFCRKFLAPISAVLMSAAMVKSSVGAYDRPVVDKETKVTYEDSCGYFINLSNFLSGYGIDDGWNVKLNERLETFLEKAKGKYTDESSGFKLRWVRANELNNSLGKWVLLLEYGNGKAVTGSLVGGRKDTNFHVIISPEEYAKLKLENASFDLIAPYTDELPEEVQSFYETADETAKNIEKKIIQSKLLEIGMLLSADAGSLYGFSKLWINLMG